jgi:hypothetical protein
MGAQLRGTDGAPAVASVEPDIPISGDEPLDEISRILAGLVKKDRQQAQGASFELDVRREFLRAFAEACDKEVRPAMDAVLLRLQRGGGGGVIEAQIGDDRYPDARLRLWMSLEGEITGPPHPDRHPYLQLDADADERRINVTEGDMSDQSGAPTSRRTDRWTISDLTGERVTREILSIVRRSAQASASSEG